MGGGGRTIPKRSLGISASGSSRNGHLGVLVQVRVGES